MRAVEVEEFDRGFPVPIVPPFLEHLPREFLKDETADDDELGSLRDNIGRHGVGFGRPAGGLESGADGFPVSEDFYFENIARLVRGGDEVTDGDAAVVGVVVVSV